jgi:hypothetical protein
MPIKLAGVVGLNVLSFDSTGGRNAPQLSGELLRMLAGPDITHLSVTIKASGARVD